MPIHSIFILFLFIPSTFTVYQSQFQEYPSNPHLFSGQDSSRKSARRLSKPLVRDDGRIYSCCERNFFAFESNGSIAWSVNLNYTCNVGIAPVHGGSRKVYLVAENRVLRINPLNIGSSESAVEIFFGPKSGEEEDEIIGFAVSTLSSSVFINVRYRGLLAYKFEGQLLWSTSPVLYQSGYRQGCRNNDKDCYFSSKPVIDQCEASVYISNTEGELYALTVRSPHFKWVQDFSSLDKSFIITPGNNGLLYVTVPVRTTVLALDVSTGAVLWQGSIGPLSTSDSAPVVDCNGWISFGSLDGFLYSFSPTGEPKKFPRANALDSVVQVSPLLDCSGYAVYLSQIDMEGKVSRTIGDYTYISAMRPRNVVFTLLVPATGFIYWFENYSESSQFSSLQSESDLRYFVLDEGILLAFIAASKIGNPLPCRSTRQKIATTCSHAEPKSKSIYIGNERAILLFLLFESAILVVLVIVVRFCCAFWKKKKLQGQDLGKFLEKRRSLRLQKKAFDRTISELQQKAAEEAMAHEVLEKLGDLVREKEGIERKLSTTYSLGRDRTGLEPKSLLPLYDGKTKSFSFQGTKKESVTIFHTLSDTSSTDSGSEKEVESNYYEDMGSAANAKGKRPIEAGSSSDDEIGENYMGTPSGSGSASASASASGLKGFMNPLFVEPQCDDSKDLTNMIDEGEVRDVMQSGGRSSIRKRTLPQLNRKSRK